MRPERGAEPDMCYDWGEGCSRRDARLLSATFSPVGGNDLFKELESRGYDLKTLRFSIRKTTL